MAKEYPNCDYKGCDIVSITNPNVIHERIQFSYGNVVEGLQFPDNTFDLVQMRLLVLGLRAEEWPIAVKEVLRVTKPGGMIQLIEVGLELCGCDHPNVVKASNAVVSSSKARGQNPYIGLGLKDLVEQVGGAKVVQVDNRSVEMAADTPVAKKFLWDWKHTAASMMPVLGPIIGLPTTAEQKVYLDGMIYGLTHSKATADLFAIAAQKL